MLAIRMQRTGRKGHANFRVVVQDSRQAPTSGKYVALLGSYDPHAKTTTLVKEKAEFYLKHGAQPSDRVARLLKQEGIKLPSWVNDPSAKERAIRNPEKLRKNRSEEPQAEAAAEEAPAEEAAERPADTPAPEAEPAETAEEAPQEAPAEEAPAE